MYCKRVFQIEVKIEFFCCKPEITHSREFKTLRELIQLNASVLSSSFKRSFKLFIVFHCNPFKVLAL